MSEDKRGFAGRDFLGNWFKCTFLFEKVGLSDCYTSDREIFFWKIVWIGLICDDLWGFL